MKERLIVVLLITIFISTTLIPQPVRAQDNQLEWGVQVGDEVSYVLQRKTMESSTIGLLPEWMRFVDAVEEGQRFSLVVESYEEIPLNLASTDLHPLSYSTITRNNDSVLLYANNTGFIIPAGDWDFQTERLELDANPQINLIDNDVEWGFIEEISFDYGEDYVNYYGELRLDKETGAISYARIRANAGTFVLDVIFAEWYDGIPTILPPDFDITGVLIIALAVTVGIIVAICVYKGYTNKKPLVQRLGE